MLDVDVGDLLRLAGQHGRGVQHRGLDAEHAATGQVGHAAPEIRAALREDRLLALQGAVQRINPTYPTSAPPCLAREISREVARRYFFR